MKKYLVTILVVLSVLAMITGTAAAAPANAAGVVTLVSAIYSNGGPMFTFEVSGEYSKDDLQGSVFVQGGESYSLYCNQVDATTVKCSGPRDALDKDIVVSFGGSQFWTFVKSREYCYSVWDFYPDNPDPANWKDYGPHCQNSAAEYGDAIQFYNPDYDATFWYYFWWEEDCFGTGITGDAFYYC